MLNAVKFRLIKLWVCWVIFAFHLNANAGPSLQDYGTLPAVSMVEISPNGNLVAFRKVVDDKDILAVTSLSEKKTVMMLDISKIQPQGILFINNEQLFFVVSETQRVAGFRGKIDTSTAFILDIKTQKIRQLLIPGDDRIYPGQSGLGRLAGISSDGEYVFMPAYLGNTDMVLGDTQDPNYGLVKVKLKSKGRHKTVASGTVYSNDFFVKPSGELLAEERYNNKTNEHSIWVFEDKKGKELFKEIVPIRTKAFVGVTADHSSLIFLETNDETGRDDYYLMNLKTGNISSTHFGRNDADIEEVIIDNNRVVQGVVYSGFTPSYKFFDPALDARIKLLIDQFPDQSVFLSSMSPDWKHIVVKVEGSQFAEDYFLFANGSDKPQFLTTSRPNIKPEDIHPIGKLIFTARDGLKIPTLITIPKDKLTNIKNLPAVIYPHGGPESHDQVEFEYTAQALAENGYLVIQPQFRGSDGFGLAHELAGRGEWGKKMQDDLTDAVKFFIGKGYIDPKKICIVGSSYGGYAALAGGAFTPELYRCVVSVNGIGDVKAMLGSDKNKFGRESDSFAYMQKQFGSETADKKLLDSMSPEKFVHQFTAPVLLIYSEDDQRVPMEQSTSMFSALKRAKKSVEKIELKNETHHMIDGKTRLQALEETVKFVNQHLK
jgi:dipeptidyl aminopeptidase/acylaminoacyl peptidase